MQCKNVNNTDGPDNMNSKFADASVWSHYKPVSSSIMIVKIDKIDQMVFCGKSTGLDLNSTNLAWKVRLTKSPFCRSVHLCVSPKSF
jgi:hypothetical protein